MTGFGRAEAGGDNVAVSVEARSVNHRHLDIALRLPRALTALEMDARRLIQARIERGRIDVSVQLGPPPGQSTQQIRMDTTLAAQYVEHARALGRAIGLGDDVPLTWVLERPGVVVRTEDPESASGTIAWPALSDVLGRALDELVASRATEGEALAAELRTQQAALKAQVDLIAARTPIALARYQERLRERIAALVGDGTRDEGRILTEVAIWAEKTDIREELTRLAAHLEQLAALLDKGGSVGRPLDFLIQELNREVNTIASKGDDLELSQSALAAKGIIEKMREQAQNLE
ncbi:MAG TPA: YicC/YloC family endoribonuclease [Methylomirabilota bacterium]|nr:YicC/YloC family endoribonuclease [Methylomirabilota bacterium]